MSSRHDELLIAIFSGFGVRVLFYRDVVEDEDSIAVERDPWYYGHSGVEGSKA